MEQKMSIKFNNIRNNLYALKNHRNCYILLRFIVCLLVIYLAYNLSLSRIVKFSSLVDVATKYHGRKQYRPSSDKRKCNIFEGAWVNDTTSPPFYNSESCNWIEPYKDCQRNGRPDKDYIYWTWKPKQCQLHKIDPKRFLDMMINKSFAFVGDSVVRNHMESLLCILSQVEQPTEVVHDKLYRNSKWNFSSYNFTIAVIWAPYLTKAEFSSEKQKPIKVHLDQLDPNWTNQYEKFDYMIFAGGKWFLRPTTYLENNTIIGCHFCPGMNLPELGFDHAYRKSLNLVFDFLTRSNHQVHTIFRTITPNHFENGGWIDGGFCNRTKPFKVGEIDVDDVDVIMHNIEIEEFEKAARGLKWKIIDVTYLSVLRPDGHPGAYGKFEKKMNDCLHWCLPGPIDTWNDLMMEVLSNSIQ